MDTFEQEALPHLDALRAFALRLTGDSDDAADLVQDTFHRALRYWSTYETGTNCRSWLFSICRRQFLLDRRRRDRRVDRPALWWDGLRLASRSAISGAAFPDPEAYARGSIFRDRVSAALSGLPECYRKPLKLLIAEEMRYCDIAEELGLPLGTVKSRIHRGRLRLKERLSTALPVAPRSLGPTFASEPGVAEPRSMTRQRRGGAHRAEPPEPGGTGGAAVQPLASIVANACSS